MKQLTEGEFHATFTNKMTKIAPNASPPFDFWDYFENIPESDFGDHDCSAGEVDQVYQTAGGRYQHVLVKSTEKNVFMVVVLNLKDRVVYGHRLLDLNEAYGL